MCFTTGVSAARGHLNPLLARYRPEIRARLARKKCELPLWHGAIAANDAQMAPNEPHAAGLARPHELAPQQGDALALGWSYAVDLVWQEAKNLHPVPRSERARRKSALAKRYG